MIRVSESDNCSFQGAKALAKKLQRYWMAKGLPRDYEIRLLPQTRGVYAVRELPTPTVNRPSTERAAPKIVVVSETPRERVRSIVREVLKAHPDVPEHSIFADTLRPNGNRCAAVNRARRACIVEVRMVTGWSLPHIAKMFHCHHSSILYALNPEWRARRNDAAKKRAAAERARLRALKPERALHPKNKSGATGVIALRGKFVAAYWRKRKQFHVGTFATLEEAVAARRQALAESA